ncbi:MAG: hypothetical protein M1591_03330 [Deltaproteobacteria bacterium]|nr:hypothetical protein [Deltaproteobacteria bacterium]
MVLDKDKKLNDIKKDSINRFGGCDMCSPGPCLITTGQFGHKTIKTLNSVYGLSEPIGFGRIILWK